MVYLNIRRERAIRIAVGLMMLGLLLAGGAGAVTLTVNSSGMNSIVKNTTAIITWGTTDFSDSMVKHGLYTGNYTFINYINESVTFHNVTLTNLSANTNYYFVVNSTNIIDSTQSLERVFWTPYDNFEGNTNLTNIEIRQLTNNEELAGSPVWIEDKIFYVSNRTGNMDVWVMDKDGANKTQITNSPSDEYPSDGWVSWENNSKVYKIIYVSKINRSSNIWVINGDGTNRTQLTNDSYENLNPVIVSVPTPVIFGMQPTGTINNNLPLINASYYSYYGNISKVNFSVDGIDETSFANISGSNLRYIPVNPLGMDQHNFTITVKTDLETKSSNTQFFKIRYISDPSPIGAVFNNTPKISANISIGYGNLSSVTFTVDEINVSLNATIHPSFIEYTPTAPLNNGSHSVSLKIESTKGFSDIENWTVCVNPGLFVCPSSSGGSSGGGGGGGYSKIIFSSNRSGNFNLWIMNLDGTRAQQMTYDSSNETSPSWVESKVVYVSDKSGNKDIWSMDVNGSNDKQLTNKALDEDKPSSSYVGGIIYTESEDGISNLEAMNTDGTGNIKITNTSSSVVIPAHSSISSQSNEGILYSSEGKGLSGIYLMNFEEKGPKVKFWNVYEDYSLKAVSIDQKNNQTWLKLLRNGISKDDRVICVGMKFSLEDHDVQKVILNATLNRISSTENYYEVELVNVTQYSSIDGNPIFTNTTKILTNKILLNDLTINTMPFMDKTPTDPDSDGLYEDINGNGWKDFNDVVVFFNYLEWVASNEQISNFDFNGNGRIDFNDIIKLFEEL